MGKKTILVTGCSDGGLGAALAVALHNSGWRVFATARNPNKMSTAKSAGIETLTLDVQSADSISACAAAVKELTGGSLDALVNNAGAGHSMPITDISVDKARKLFDLNVWSLVSTTQAFLPLLMKSQSGGLLVNNTSIAGVMGIPFQGIYNASKAAAVMLSENLRLELAPFGVKVVDLRTGGILTNFYSNTKENHSSLELPEDSIYQVAREPVEEVLSGLFGGKPPGEGGPNADAWAKGVVADLNKKNLPAHIWGGKGATSVWLATYLPHGLLDSQLKKMTNLDKVEAALKSQRQRVS